MKESKPRRNMKLKERNNNAWGLLGQDLGREGHWGILAIAPGVA